MPWTAASRSHLGEVPINQGLWSGEIVSNLIAPLGAGTSPRYGAIPETAQRQLPGNGPTLEIDGLVIDRESVCLRVLEFKSPDSTGYANIAAMTQALAALHAISSTPACRDWAVARLHAARDNHVDVDSPDYATINSIITDLNSDDWRTVCGVLIVDGWNRVLRNSVLALHHTLGVEPDRVRYAYGSAWRSGNTTLYVGLEGIEEQAAIDQNNIPTRIHQLLESPAFGEPTDSVEYCNGDRVYYTNAAPEPPEEDRVAYSSFVNGVVFAMRYYGWSDGDLKLYEEA